jgi:hypothetical protein
MSRQSQGSRRKKVKRELDGYWIWLRSPIRPGYRVTGKYLFFSKDRERLLQIAENEILNHEFHRAKVNMNLIGESIEHVLCLYYKDDSRKHELAQRQEAEYPDIKYRYWKSDEATLKGEYSSEFLSKLSEDEKEFFTSDKRPHV